MNEHLLAACVLAASNLFPKAASELVADEAFKLYDAVMRGVQQRGGYLPGEAVVTHATG